MCGKACSGKDSLLDKPCHFELEMNLIRNHEVASSIEKMMPGVYVEKMVPGYLWRR